MLTVAAMLSIKEPRELQDVAPLDDPSTRVCCMSSHLHVHGLSKIDTVHSRYERSPADADAAMESY